MPLTKRQELWVSAAKKAKREGNSAWVMFSMLAYPATGYPLKEPDNSDEVFDALYDADEKATIGMCVALYTRNIVGQPEVNEEVFLCGTAQEVWEYLRDQMMWYSEPITFNPGIASVRSWNRSGALRLYYIRRTLT